jgi:ABC-type transport system involved in multi-copper enzyme maturation permease subunit
MSRQSTAASPTRLPASDRQLWQRGFATVLRREVQTWWPRRLLSSLAIWTALAIVVPFGLSSRATVSTTEAGALETQAIQGLSFFFTILTALPMFGAIFSVRGAISDERKTGTLAWVLSKPVFRWAFYSAKLLANWLMRFGIVVVFQGLLAGAIVAAQGGLTAPLNFVGALLLVALLLLFYVSLTLMLDTLFAKGALAIALPVAVLMGGGLVPTLVFFLTRQRDLATALTQLTPWGLSSTELTNLALGESQPSWIPIFCTLLWSIGFTAFGLWQFQRQEV